MAAPNFKIISSITLIFLFLWGGCGRNDDSSQTEETSVVTIEEKVETPSAVPGVRRIKVKNIGSLSQTFNDSNYLQLESAKNLGIQPVTGLYTAYFTDRPIVKITDTENFKLDSLTHSLPFLVPEAAELLNDIGRTFKDSLRARGGDSHLIKVTSLLRTPQTVSRLRRVNINATDSSTHQYATTFDISYVNFYCSDSTRLVNQGDLKNLLAEVLLEMKNQGRCMVKYERKTGCFHVTVTN